MNIRLELAAVDRVGLTPAWSTGPGVRWGPVRVLVPQLM